MEGPGTFRRLEGPCVTGLRLLPGNGPHFEPGKIRFTHNVTGPSSEAPCLGPKF